MTVPGGKKPFKGRGAVSNRAGRFEKTSHEPFDDGWDTLTLDPPSVPKTTVRDEQVRSIITRNQSPDIPFDQSINPYRGCEHGCIYCYARQSHAYLGHSAGLDFETKLYHKANAAAQLETQLRKPSYVCKTITIGANTDAYQPIERHYQLTRQILEVCAAYRQPVAIITKSALIQRDIDILTDMARDQLATVIVSLTTLDNRLARLMEPRAAAPFRRLETIAAIHQAGIPVTVNVAPVIPAINDAELDRILAAAATAGAQRAGYILLRLPLEVADLYEEWLATHFPDRAAHAMSLLRQCRGGLRNVAEFGKRMRGQGPFADLLRNRFRLACKRFGLNKTQAELVTHKFKLPPRAGDQLPLFEP